MLLYDVFYRNSQYFDSKVGLGYLLRLAKSKANEGARAVCINGEPKTLTLKNGEWKEEVDALS